MSSEVHNYARLEKPEWTEEPLMLAWVFSTIISKGTIINDRFNFTGDSGSGLFRTLNDKPYLDGITSFGLSCGSTFPSVYTRVASRISWIESHVWPEN